MFCIAVPPSKPVIFDESGREVKDLVGPYLEGETIVLKCITSGGTRIMHSLSSNTYSMRTANSFFLFFWRENSNFSFSINQNGLTTKLIFLLTFQFSCDKKTLRYSRKSVSRLGKLCDNSLQLATFHLQVTPCHKSRGGEIPT